MNLLYVVAGKIILLIYVYVVSIIVACKNRIIHCAW